MAQVVSAEELERFECGNENYSPTLSKPTKFDLRKGKGSRWNNKMCHLLAIECEKALQAPEPCYRVTRRVQKEQLEELMRQKYERAWTHYSLTRLRVGENEEERTARVLNSLDNTDRRKRAHSARKAKYNNRLDTTELQIKRGESLAAMELARSIIEELGDEGMSSEDELLDAHGLTKGFKVSKLPWRNTDVGKVLQKIDAIRRQIKDTRGAIPAPRFQGEITQRKAVEYRSFQIYEREWLEVAIESRNVVREPPTRGLRNWAGYPAWERML